MTWLAGFAGALGGWIGGMLATGRPFISMCGAVGGFVGCFYAVRNSTTPNGATPKSKRDH